MKDITGAGAPAGDEARRGVFLTLLRYTGWLVALSLLCQGLYLYASANDATTQFSEASLAEMSQNVMLVVSLLLLWRIRTLGQYRHVVVMLFGLLLASLIREQDRLLDAVFDSLWQWLVTLVVLPVLLYMIRYRHRLLDELGAFMQTAPFGIFSAGFMTLYLFSRLIGRGDYWQAVMAERYHYPTKSAVEESIEVLGYALMLIALVELWLLCRRLRARAL